MTKLIVLLCASLFAFCSMVAFAVWANGRIRCITSYPYDRSPMTFVDRGARRILGRESYYKPEAVRLNRTFWLVQPAVSPMGIRAIPLRVRFAHGVLVDVLLLLPVMALTCATYHAMVRISHAPRCSACRKRLVVDEQCRCANCGNPL